VRLKISERNNFVSMREASEWRSLPDSVPTKAVGSNTLIARNTARRETDSESTRFQFVAGRVVIESDACGDRLALIAITIVNRVDLLALFP
jgi:hypothetical protein